jgi:hypothetical protein
MSCKQYVKMSKNTSPPTLPLVWALAGIFIINTAQARQETQRKGADKFVQAIGTQIETHRADHNRGNQMSTQANYLRQYCYGHHLAQPYFNPKSQML